MTRVFAFIFMSLLSYCDGYFIMKRSSWKSSSLDAIPKHEMNNHVFAKNILTVVAIAFGISSIPADAFDNIQKSNYGMFLNMTVINHSTVCTDIIMKAWISYP